jgi:hypothetical protein
MRGCPYCQNNHVKFNKNPSVFRHYKETKQGQNRLCSKKIRVGVDFKRSLECLQKKVNRV